MDTGSLEATQDGDIRLDFLVKVCGCVFSVLDCDWKTLLYALKGVISDT